MPGLVAIPDASFFVKAQQTGDFHETLSGPGLRLRVVIPRAVFWELDDLRFQQDMAFTVREVRRRLEQLLRTQQEQGVLVSYETDLDMRLQRDQRTDEQLIAYAIQRARRFPRDRYVLLSDDVAVRNFALLSPDLQQLRNVYVSSLEEWADAADWLGDQAEPGDVSGWAVQTAKNVIQEVEGELLQGLTIGVACDITDFAFGEATVRIWFQDAATEIWLEDRNGEYQTGGYVTLTDRVAVHTDRERYEHSFFMPYDELHLEPGSHQIALAVNVINPRTGRQVGEAAWAEFYHRERQPVVKLHNVEIQPASVRTEAHPAGEGLEVGTAFTIDSWRGRQAEIRVYFRDAATGEPLKDKNGQYVCDAGTVCACETFVPHREHSRYRRMSVFIPGNELHLPDRGPRQLECTVTFWAIGFQRELLESDWIAFTVGGAAQGG